MTAQEITALRFTLSVNGYTPLPLFGKSPPIYGKTLVWDALEVAQHIAQRVAARDLVPENNEGAPTRERPFDSETDPLATGRNELAPCPYRTDET